MSSTAPHTPHPAPLTGTCTLPGDKSISHRAVLFSLLRPGTYHLSNIATNADVAASAAAITQLGARIEQPHPDEWIITSPVQPSAPTHPIDCHNSGTTMRLLCGLLAGLQQPATLIGDASLSARPMGRVIKPLHGFGATITGTGTTPNPVTAPIRISPAPLSGQTHQLAVASAQVKSALLLAATFAHGPTTLTEPTPTRDHTERLFQHMGIPLSSSTQATGHTHHTVPGDYTRPPLPQSPQWAIPGDISSAAFLTVAALITPGSRLTLRNVLLNPSRTGVLTALAQWGVKCPQSNQHTLQGEPVGDLTITHQPLQGHCTLQGDIIANLIDEIPILAMAGLFSTGGLTVRGAEELRHKESDRISVLAQALQHLGYTITEHPDGFTLPGNQSWQGTLPNHPLITAGDHRIAMALRVLNHAVCPNTPWPLDDPHCVTVSFPDFDTVLTQLTHP